MTELQIVAGVILYAFLGGVVLGIFAGRDKDFFRSDPYDSSPLPAFVVVGWPVAFVVLIGMAGYSVAKRATKVILEVLA